MSLRFVRIKIQPVTTGACAIGERLLSTTPNPRLYKYPWKNLFVTPAASGQRRVPYQLHQFFAAAFGSNATEV
ncbi:hypothetical protein OPV22_031752 [Ensete ventricosum]|uniref:Uncharacterized protein n=1 Tax=Ensete ventricosum TaxID=4639 RepID=A0AAV8P1I5_ENSVE|nr:hypothetical protein OPV22_031752 [Ensete ventricosum]